MTKTISKKNNMTTKEETQELFDKFVMEVLDRDGTSAMNGFEVKQCVLIAIEFAREQFYKYCSAEMGTVGSYDDHFDVLKQEVENL